MPHIQSPLSVLRHRDFRLLWLGLLISRIGSEMQVVAIVWHVYVLTHSPFYLGVIGASRFIPMLIFGLFGGIASDSMNRKKVMLYSQIVMALCSIILAATTLTGHINITLIFIILAINTIATAFDTPSRQSLVPLLIPKDEFVKAISLNTIMWQSAIVLGPSLAGFTIAYGGVGTVYAVNTVSFLAVIGALIMMGPVLHERTKAHLFDLRSMKEGLRFVFRTPLIYSGMFLDFIATFFGSASTLMPIYATDILHVGAQGLGFLYAAPAIGAIVSGLVISSIHRMKNQGKILLISVTIYGLAMILFGISHNFILSLIFLAVAGAGDSVSAIIRNTIRQLSTPDYIRGRMVSINQIFFYGGPQLGEVEAGFAAGLFSTPFAVITGGIATIVATLLIGYFTPKLRRYQGHELIT